MVRASLLTQFKDSPIRELVPARHELSTLVSTRPPP